MATAAGAQRLCFGDFELDLGAHQLRLRGNSVHLERRPFELLVLLATNHGQLVSRDDVIRKLWPPKVIIDFDTGLNTLVRKVRKALGDSPDNPQFIETVPGVGYRFIAPVTDSAADADAARPSTFRWRPVAVAIVFLVAAIAMGSWYPDSREPARTSIAVLPFENLTADPELDYLAAGLAEETSLSLSQIDLPNLVLIGGVSSRAITNSVLSLQDIGRANNIDYVVQSSLRLDRTRLRVTSRLIRTADSEQIWSASFDREMTNVLGLQSELSIAIAEQVRQRLSPDVAAAIDRRQTRNPEAYELYLKGRYEWTQFLPMSVPRALEYYEQAVAVDPGYALAWAGMAHALVTSTVTIGAQPQSVRAAAEDALQRALEYGPDLAETQLALGSFEFFLDRDFAAAQEAARRAVALDPNSAMCHMFLGIVLAQSGEYIEARDMMRRARELDPLFPLMFANSANVALTAGDPNAALELATQAIAINPEFWVGYLHLGGAHLALGNLDDALQAYATAEKLSGGNSKVAMAWRAYILTRLGRDDEARDILATLVTQAETEYVAPYNFAVIHSSLGEIDTAINWLEIACSTENAVFDIRNDQRLDTLRADMRFKRLEETCGYAGQSPDTGKSSNSLH
jgi:TolB-like protein/Tfp pilus assembly protein PilF